MTGSRTQYSLSLFGPVSVPELFKQMIENFLPPSIVDLVVKRDPSPGIESMRKASRLTERVANSLIEAKAQALISGKGSRDVFSLLGESRLGIAYKYISSISPKRT